MPTENQTSIEFLRPDQIVEKARQPGLVLIPISPAYEWHSHHMPVGTDAIIAEEVARRLAQRLHATYFRVLALGLDEVRDHAFKAMQGLDPATPVFGMNYPGLPLESEYTTTPVMRALIESRLQAAQGSGFRRAALVNHHGGCGQRPLLDEIAKDWTTASFRVDSLSTQAGPDFKPPPEYAAYFRVGGHAGLAETLQLMAFRPDLVDLSTLPEGPLRAATLGILHHQPDIPEAYSPRHATPALARLWGDHVLDRLEAALRVGQPGPAKSSPM